MKKKKYIMPRVLTLDVTIEKHLAAGSWQSDEPGAKTGDSFEEELNAEEDADFSLPPMS